MHTYDQQKVETLDKVITKGLLHAEHQCKHYQRLPWSPEINELVTKINMMKLTLTSMNNKIDMTKQIASQRKNLKTEFTIPATKDELNKEIREARKQIRIEWKKKRSQRTSLYEDQEQAFIEANPKLDPKRQQEYSKQLN